MARYVICVEESSAWCGLPWVGERFGFAAIGVFAMIVPGAAQQRDPFYWLGEMNKASAVMVVETGIVPKPLGAKIADAVARVIADGDKPGAPRSGNYLIVEDALIKAGGPDVTRLHSGRSRQDIGATMQRLAMREDLLDGVRQAQRARASVAGDGGEISQRDHPGLHLGRAGAADHARPLSCSAYAAALARDAERMRQAYARLNLSPLGAAALGTSSFPGQPAAAGRTARLRRRGGKLARRQPDFADRYRRGSGRHCASQRR